MRIVVNNSYSRAEGYTPQQFQQLRTLLSYRVADPFYSGGRSPVRYLIDKKGEFMTGLLPRVLDFARIKHWRVETQDIRIKPAPRPGTFKMRIE